MLEFALTSAEPVFQQGEAMVGLVWNRIWATNPDVQMKLDASVDGVPLRLEKLGTHLWNYALPRLELGVHVFEVNVYLAGQPVDDVLSYISVVPKISSGRTR